MDVQRCHENMNIQYANQIDSGDMIYTTDTKDTGDTEAIKQLENEMNKDETVLTMTQHRDGDKSHPFEG